MLWIKSIPVFNKGFACLAGLICLGLGAGPLMAQPTDSLFYPRDILGYRDLQVARQDEEAKVVSAIRSNKNLVDLPFSIYIISREEIQRNQYTTLVDVLKSVPGVKVSQPGSGQDGELFLMRGQIGNAYTKILVNDIPIQPSVNGSFPIASQLPIRQAERIEIIFGPASALYGRDAMSGVINIITQVPRNTTFAQADVKRGTNGYHYLNFGVGGKFGRNRNVVQYSFYGNVAGRRDLNLALDDDDDLFNPLNFLPIDDLRILDTAAFISKFYQPLYKGELTRPIIRSLPQESRLFGLQVNYKGFRFSYDHMFRRSHSAVGATPYLFSYANPNNFLSETIQRTAFSYEFQKRRLGGITNASYLRMRYDPNSSIGNNYNIETQGNSYVYAASDDLFAEQLLFFQPNKQLELLTGVSLRFSGNLPQTNERTDPFDTNIYNTFGRQLGPRHPLLGHFGMNPIRFFNAGAFVQAFASIKRLTLIAGSRVDYSTFPSPQFTTHPRAAVLYNVTEFSSLRASLGTAFRAPTAEIAYNSVAYVAGNRLDSIAYQVVPQPDLKPERVISAEVGYRRRALPGFDLEFLVFWKEIENLIQYLYPPVDRNLYPLSVMSNVRKAGNNLNAESQLWGLQFALRGKNVIPALKLDSDLHIAYFKGKESLPSLNSLIEIQGEIDDFRMTPRWMFQWRISSQPKPRWYFNLQWVAMTSWVRRFTPTVESYSDPFFRIPGYVNLDLIANYQINSFLQGFLQIRNVFNEAYAGIGAFGLDIDLRYNPQLGRNVQIGLSISL